MNNDRYGFAGLNHRHQRSLQRLSGHDRIERGIVDEERMPIGPVCFDARAVQRIAVVACLALIIRAGRFGFSPPRPPEPSPRRGPMLARLLAQDRMARWSW
jgi:hypothetical protein